MAVDFITNLEKGMEELHKRGAFLTVRSGEKVNTMTISWGSIGFIWGKPTLTALIRKSRFTHELIENADSFTISIPYGDEMKSALGICGTKSGRDIDKVAEAGIKFVSSNEVSSPVVDGCNMYYECKIVYKQDMDESFVSPEVKKRSYAKGDYHTMYYGEIVSCYEK
jgi:flavin reductase (DIM6/NTAB) family NADH-FMN oxidoreductase RutF